MAYSITQFQNSAGPDQLSALDNNIVTLNAAAPIPCGIAGTNTLTLTPNAAGLVPTSNIVSLLTNMTLTGIASATNTGPVTAAFGSFAALSVYKDSLFGPALLSGDEIVATNAISFRYDAALNSGSGGFHLISNTSITGTEISPSAVQINLGSTIISATSGGSPTLTFTATPGMSSQDQAFSVTAAIGNAGILPQVGDFVQVNPPSLGATGVDFRGYIIGSGSLSLSSVSIVSCSTINIRLLNAASASLASNSGIYRYVAQRFTP